MLDTCGDGAVVVDAHGDEVRPCVVGHVLVYVMDLQNRAKLSAPATAMSDDSAALAVACDDAHSLLCPLATTGAMSLLA